MAKNLTRLVEIALTIIMCIFIAKVLNYIYVNDHYNESASWERAVLHDFYTLDENRSTKDKSVIMDKLEVLESLMCEYLHINKEDLKEVDVLDFVRENVNPDVTQEDIGLYKDMLRDFSSKVDEKSKLLDNQNQASMIAIIAYACDRDMQIDSWILDYSNRNDSYIDDQVENFQYMKCDMEEFIKLSEVA